MTRLVRAEGAEELLDAPLHDPAELEQSLAQVAAVNRWLGGTRALLSRLDAALVDTPSGRALDVVDVGTGSADVPRALLRHARGRRIALRVLALDLHPQTARVAARRCAGESAIRVAAADARALPLGDGSVDVAMLSMTLHHLDGAAQVGALRELRRVARRAVVVGELERSWPGYLGARLLAATVWRGNRLTRHDGPLSVRRAFTPDELEDLGRAAELREVRVTRHPLFRLVLTGRP